MSPSRSFFVIAILGVSGLVCSCDQQQETAPAIGHAWAGPANLKLRKEIDPKSPAVATVHFGDRLDIIAQRRRWYQVRTTAGVEGWTSDRELLDAGQMRRLRALAAETDGMPSQGVATTFGNLNVHAEPSRQSPSFVQVKEHEKVDVIAHKVTPRNAEMEKRELILPRPKPEKKEKPSKVPSPPAPRVPPPPSDWLELSKEADPPELTEAAPQGPVDDWTLIRIGSGQSGWVLTSGLYLMIPDEVAQYAEGHRITSYFSIGKIRDGDQQKDIWLWTTSEKLDEDHDFDSYRVFTWSLRHHRYETAYIQRRERGFFPVMAKEGQFSVCLERDDGSRARVQYTMMGNAVRSAGEVACKKTAEQDVAPQNLITEAVRPRASRKSLLARMEAKVKGLFGKS